MNKIVKILMERDGISEEEAIELIEDVKNYMLLCIENGDYAEAEIAFEDGIGLEPDYIEYIL